MRPGLVGEVLSRMASGSPAEFDWGRQGRRVAGLFENIVRSGEIPDAELAQLEWKLLPFVRCDPRFSRVGMVLAGSPAFFVELLTSIYGSAHQAIQDVTRGQHNRAKSAYELLSRWHQCPGLKADGSVETETLNAWVAQVREMATGLGRLTAADGEIGKVMAHYPPGDDGAWPHDAIRNLIERLASDAFEGGIILGLTHHRSAVGQSLADRVAQVDRHRESAGKLLEGWPRTFRVMKEVARSYEQLSGREHSDVEHGHKLCRL